MKVHLRMIGCRLNQSEIDTMARQLQAQGHEIVQNPAEADQVILNTCAVTNDATKTSRKLIREYHRNNPAAEINVTGCYAQIAPNDIAMLSGVKRVVDNDQKETLVSQLTEQDVASFDYEPIERDAIPGTLGRTRAFIKVQDGCDNACTFCVTTIARGSGRSRPMSEIIEEVHYLYSIGYQEVVLTGVHLGSYGHDWGDPTGLVHLIKALLADTDIPRIRLSSLEPWDLSDNFFDLWEHPRLCRHLHLPLQSGCDATLKRMRRNTNQTAFRNLIQVARSKISDVRITSDVIVGFPGETEEEFNESEAFIHEMDFAGLHVFRYSSRPETPAARMRAPVTNAVKKQRSRRLMILSQKGEHRFAESLNGQLASVLWEQVTGATEDGFINVGYTDNYVRVQAIHLRPLTNQITLATLHEYTDGVVRATPVLK